MRQLITNANIIDGTGKNKNIGQLLIEHNKIIDINFDLPAKHSADITIDANYATVCPSFIDVHSHADLAPFIDNGFKAKVTQGISTEIVGLCGLGVTPMPKNLQTSFRERLIIGNPKIKWNWHDFPSYFKALKQTGLEVNLAAFLPHGLLRYQICGDNPAAMTTKQLMKLENLTEVALAAGAIGISLGLIYHPAIFSNNEELKVLAKVAANYDKPLVVHMRSESDEILEALQDIIEVAESKHCKLHISHLKIIGKRNAHKLPQLLSKITEHNLTFDQYPYNYGSTTLLSILPPALLRDYSGDCLFLALGALAIRKQVKNWFNETIKPQKGEPWDNIPALVGWSNILICEVNTPEAYQWLGHTINECAQLCQQHPVDFVLDLLIQQKGLVRMIDYFMDETLISDILSHPNGMIGTDTIFGGQLHPRVHGTFPKVINEYVKKHQIITLEKAIYKMTHLSASTFGLKNRGKVVSGYFADLCMFNEDFTDHATVKNPNQLSSGLKHLWINGQRKIIDFQYTDTKSGDVIT